MEKYERFCRVTVAEPIQYEFCVVLVTVAEPIR